MLQDNQHSKKQQIFSQNSILQKFLFSNCAWKNLCLQLFLRLSLTHSRPLDSKNDINFARLFLLEDGIFDAILDLVLQLLGGIINTLFRKNGAVPFQCLKTLVTVNSSTLLPTRRQVIFLKWNGSSLSQRYPHLHCAMFSYFSNLFSGENTLMWIHSQNVVVSENYIAIF